MANRYKQKGKRLEEKVSQILNQKYNLPEGSFKRALSSGTYKYEYKSDIIFSFINPNPFIIECKNREQWKYTDILYFKNDIYKWFSDLYKRYIHIRDKYINKLIKNTNNNIKDFVYILIVSKAYHPIYVIFNEDNILNSNLFEKDNNNDNWQYIIKIKTDKYNTLTIMDINDFCNIYKLKYINFV